MTADESFQHHIRRVWTWTEGEDSHFLRWECQCGWLQPPSRPLTVFRGTTHHQILRESHFNHVRSTKKDTDL